jgi:geranylgeranyl reductase family protein
VNKQLDLIVIGCSATGALAARDAARLGLRAACLEEHARPGKGGACSGLVSRRGLTLLDADAALERDGVVLNEVRGAVLHVKNGASLTVARRASVACVLDRQKFDEALAKQASAAGAEIKLRHRVTAVQQTLRGVTVRCGAKRFESEFVIGADGATSLTAAALGFPKIPRFVLGYEAEFEGAKTDAENEEFVELFFDSRAFPGFFAWLIPAGRKKVRAGFATRDFASFAYSKNAFFRLPPVEALVKNPRAKRAREYAHVIPVSVRSRTQSRDGRVLLVGDAAGQVKATTGGGIVFGGLCARQAASSIKKALDSNSLPDYERSWRKKYGATLKLHSFTRRALNSLGDAGLNAFVGVGKHAGLEWFLREFGDMDFVFK